MELNRRRFFGAGGLTLLSASMWEILSNIPSDKPNPTCSGTLQADGWMKILEEAVSYPKFDAHNHVWAGNNAEQGCRSCELLGIINAVFYPGRQYCG